MQEFFSTLLGVEELNRFLELRDETYQEWVESAGNPGNQGLFNEVAVGAVERDTRYKDQLRTMADSHADDATKPKASITGRLAKDTRVRSGTGGFNQKPEIPSSADEGELWSTLDHRFVTLKLKTPTERRRRELEEEIAQARLKHILNRYEAAFPSAWIEAYIRYLEGLLEDRYRVSCEVWQEQGNPLSPQFLREVFTKGIEVTIELLGEHFREEFRRQFGAIKNRPDSDPILQSGRGRMNEAKQRLRNNWYIRTELEARELEYAIARRERTPMGSQTPETAPEAAPEPEQARAAVTATTGEPSTGTAPEDSQRNGTEQQDATTPKREFTCSPDYRSGSLPENDAGLCG